MNGCSLGIYPGGTAFVGLSTFRPTAFSPFQFAAVADSLAESLGTTSIPKAAVTSAVVGAGFGLYVRYTGFLDGNVRVPRKSRAIGSIQVQNTTVSFEEQDVGVHWMDFTITSGHYPLNVASHSDNGFDCVLNSAFDPGLGQSAADFGPYKWFKFPAGYFPLNIAPHIDDGNVSLLKSPFDSAPQYCAAEEVSPPLKWTEYQPEFIQPTMDPKVDDEVPFGHIIDPICPTGSEKAERAFELIRYPPTPLYFKPTSVQSTIESTTRFVRPFVVATVFCLSIALAIVGFLFWIQLKQRISHDVEGISLKQAPYIVEADVSGEEDFEDAIEPPIETEDPAQFEDLALPGDVDEENVGPNTGRRRRRRHRKHKKVNSTSVDIDIAEPSGSTDPLSSAEDEPWVEVKRPRRRRYRKRPSEAAI